ncbi:Mu-like prophage major head subunit gpT family protein [Gilvimarinus agarilyticus]|uniref:Mu-like prophage major head subunit gpT family protein n=1 Tax=Gilvimarinus agarilyticus TaxID=679259 RepID=UPI0005A0F461|nr:Mu-like prophage major head subunit gpT family protein [Gilvimarinus agarilyticus]
MIVNRQNLTTLFTAFKSAFAKAFEGAAIDHDRLVLTVKSTTGVEEYAWLGSTTQFREWVGDRVIQALKQHGYSIKNKSFENTVGVPRENIEDDQYGVYTPLMAQLGQDAKEHPAQLVYALLAGGFTGKCYDGQPFFDTDHPVLNAAGQEVSVSNFAGGSGTAWYLIDDTRHIKPLILQNRKPYNFVMMDQEKDENVFMRKEYLYGVDARLNVGYGLWQLAYASKQELTSENFNTAYAAMQGLKGDNGRPLGIRPKLLVVPPSLRAKALEVVKAERAANGATNINRDVVDVLSTPWLQ